MLSLGYRRGRLGLDFEIWKPLSIADSSVVVIESLSELRAPCIILKNRELSCLRDFWMDRNWVLISVLLVWRVQSCENLFDFDFEISRGQFLNVGAFLLF
jgi:hypothetical protein